MRDAGLPVELLETRHVRDALKAMPVKTDRKDARGIAQLMRLGWFRPVHCKSLPAQEVRALLTARKLLHSKNHDVEMSLEDRRRRRAHRPLRGRERHSDPAGKGFGPEKLGDVPSGPYRHAQSQARGRPQSLPSCCTFAD